MGPSQAKTLSEDEIRRIFDRDDSKTVWILTVGWLLSLVLVPILGGIAWSIYHSYTRTVTTEFKLQRLVGTIEKLNRDLTSSVRLAALTGESKWRDQYKRLAPRIDQVLAEASLLAGSAYDENYAANAKLAYVEILEMETVVFGLAREGRLEEAQQLVFGDEYRKQKQTYNQSLDDLTEAIQTQVKANLDTARARMITVGVVGLGVLIALGLIWSRILFVVKRHLDERRRAEDALLEKLSIIEDLYGHILQAGKAQVIAEHTARVAHELRQPLAIIGGFARRMKRAADAHGEAQPDGQEQPLDVIVKEVARLEKILAGLIDYTRREQVRMERIDPNELISYVIDVLEDTIREKNLKLDINLQYEIGDILVDPERFQQVVRNLIGTAIEVSEPGAMIYVETGVSRPAETIGHASGLEDAEYFQMKIRNHGARLPHEELERVFDPFAVTETYGTGLSLTLARKIIEEHHGSVSIASDDDGTVFIAMIPAATGDEKSNEGASS